MNASETTNFFLDESSEKETPEGMRNLRKRKIYIDYSETELIEEP
jgi:hypothetical protein